MALYIELLQMKHHMHTTIPSAMRRLAAGLALAALTAFAPAVSAQETGAQVIKELSPVEISRKKNPGDLAYTFFFKAQSLLQSFLPPEPRTIDMRFRLSFAGITGAARDEYFPDTWAVAIVGDTIDHTVPISRGGYFLIPALEQALEEKATLMFNTQTRRNNLSTAWKLRIAEGQRLAYADFARAFDEVKVVQKQIPWYRIGLHEERTARFDGLKACFLEAGGRIDIDGQPAATSTEGTCQILKFDPSAANAGQAEIAFSGPLDIVTLHEVRK